MRWFVVFEKPNVDYVKCGFLLTGLNKLIDISWKPPPFVGGSIERQRPPTPPPRLISLFSSPSPLQLRALSSPPRVPFHEIASIVLSLPPSLPLSGLLLRKLGAKRGACPLLSKCSCTWMKTVEGVFEVLAVDRLLSFVVVGSNTCTIWCRIVNQRVPFRSSSFLPPSVCTLNRVVSYPSSSLIFMSYELLPV